MGFNSGFKGLITCCIAYHTRGLKRLRVICHNLPCSILVHRPSWRILTTHKPCLSITTSWLFTFALLTYLFTPWSRVLLEKLTGSQLVIKFPAFYETRRFITAFTSARHLSLSWARSTQSMHPHPTYWRFTLILSSHLCLGLPSGLFPSDFHTKTLYTPLTSPIHATCPAHLTYA